MKAGWIAALATAIVVLAGCQRQTDNLVEFGGHVFVFNYRVAVATYLVTLNKKAPIPDGSVAIAEFENPSGGDPLVTNEKIYPFWDKITIQSPAVHCVKKDRPYVVNVRLVDAGGKTLQSLQTKVISSVDQSVMPGKPLVVGPFYNKNPEVFKADGTTDYDTKDTCPST
ncbi:hypothetical protein FZ934_03895 [Rhizobium grahamii]|uniref:DUF3304 domain-containing protein n=1 Tax=Rhizobium grahamii TaxID=1120045 RepID=A0A5Q0C7P5_9HYPH|nr:MULTISPECIES: hypothetical protein [Rhizobium]QFY59649.1 hypothetical protein FZ934_03895 [Rhizobium grahamii]QRM51240.1 hypothetical protein F3Y33_18995 [Rhizobium sp. BG6]